MVNTFKVHLLDLKSEMERNGEMLIDFTENNFRVKYDDPNLIITKIMLVQERHLGRLDLLAYDSYGDVNSMDILMKFNLISNPFSMNLYDLIAVPDAESARIFYQKEKLSTIQGIKDTKALFIDPKRASQKDLARIKQLEKLASKRQNGSTEIKPTNLLRDKEVPFSTDGNRLIFAPSVSKPRFPSSNDLTQ
jgi:hypothetical protein